MKLNKFIYSFEDNKTHNIYTIMGLKFKFRKGRFETKFKRKEKPCDVGIISFNINTDVSNYGAALHSYALQKFLNKKGVDNVIINYYPESVKFTSKYIQIYEDIKNKQYSEVFYKLQNLYYMYIKKIMFYKFFKKHCKITKYRYEIDTLYQLKNINRFICNTDVTWCKFKMGGFDRGFLCDLPNMKKKDNVAYSVDIGAQELSDKKKKALKKYAKNFKYLSFRNIFRLEEIKEVIERDDAVITIDPTLLLNEEDYKEIIKKPKDTEFVFVYNCKENDDEMVKKASEYAKLQNLPLKIINCYDKNITNLKNSYPTPNSIEEFLGYIKYCKYFFTNSYHGICFAILFKTNFCCFSRKANNDKILTLLELFNLQDRLYRLDNIPSKNIDYDNLENLLKVLRQSSEDFIKKSIINEVQNEKGNC